MAKRSKAATAIRATQPRAGAAADDDTKITALNLNITAGSPGAIEQLRAVASASGLRSGNEV